MAPTGGLEPPWLLHPLGFLDRALTNSRMSAYFRADVDLHHVCISQAVDTYQLARAVHCVYFCVSRLLNPPSLAYGSHNKVHRGLHPEESTHTAHTLYHKSVYSATAHNFCGASPSITSLPLLRVCTPVLRTFPQPCYPRPRITALPGLLKRPGTSPFCVLCLNPGIIHHGP